MAGDDDIRVSDSNQRQKAMRDELKGLRDLAHSVNNLTTAFNRFGGAGITATGSTQHTQLSQGLHHELQRQTDYLKKILEKLNSRGGGMPGAPPGDGGWTGVDLAPLRGMAALGARLQKMFSPLRKSLER